MYLQNISLILTSQNGMFVIMMDLRNIQVHRERNPLRMYIIVVA